MSLTTSKQFSLNIRDFLLSLAVAALSGPIMILLTSLQAGRFNIDWTQLWQLAVSSAAGYLLKNWLTPSQTVIKPPISEPTIQPDSSSKN